VKRGIPPGREKHPVVFVSYADVEGYAAWAGKRLPTADEWEVAARGPDKREFPWGNAFTEKENVFHCNCVEYWQLTKNPPGTLAVDAFDAANSASFYGVYGMGGNVWEWTSSKKMRMVGGKPEEFRVLKGGSFMTGARSIRCASVMPEDPTLALPDVGFRCVKDVK
jgi:formylglycine-generating enzyme required for sulfatase activity